VRAQVAFFAAVAAGSAAAQGTVTDSVLDSLAKAGGETAAALERAFDALDPAFRGALAPVLAAWIRNARNAALDHGAAEIPRDIRSALTGYVPAEILDAARWRVDDTVFSLEQSLFRLGYTQAVTLDNVIVFAKLEHVSDPELWAHELFHVMQYRDWGVDGFVERYLEDYETVEGEAAKFRWRWARAAGRVPQPL
jgi:hypothetical protein